MAIVHSAAFFAFARVFFCMALCARVNFILLACPEYLRAYWPCIRARIHGVLARFRATLGFCTRTINKTEHSFNARPRLACSHALAPLRVNDPCGNRRGRGKLVYFSRGPLKTNRYVKTDLQPRTN